MTTLFSQDLDYIRDNKNLYRHPCSPRLIGDPFQGPNDRKIERQSLHPWRYFVAAGESLTKIQRLRYLYILHEDIYRKFAKAVGASGFDGNYFHIDHSPKDLGSIRKDGYRYFKRGRYPDFKMSVKVVGVFLPNDKTAAGHKLLRISKRLATYRQPAASFAAWLEWTNIRPNPHGNPFFDREKKSVELELINREIIIKVPVIVSGFFGEDGQGGSLSAYQETWIVPPGSRSIAVSDYFKKLEHRGALGYGPALINPAHALG